MMKALFLTTSFSKRCILPIFQLNALIFSRAKWILVKLTNVYYTRTSKKIIHLVNCDFCSLLSGNDKTCNYKTILNSDSQVYSFLIIKQETY